jgi:hypothetical protein
MSAAQTLTEELMWWRSLLAPFLPLIDDCRVGDDGGAALDTDAGGGDTGRAAAGSVCVCVCGGGGALRSLSLAMPMSALDACEYTRAPSPCALGGPGPRGCVPSHARRNGLLLSAAGGARSCAHLLVLAACHAVDGRDDGVELAVELCVGAARRNERVMDVLKLVHHALLHVLHALLHALRHAHQRLVLAVRIGMRLQVALHVLTRQREPLVTAHLRRRCPHHGETAERPHGQSRARMQRLRAEARALH